MNDYRQTIRGNASQIQDLYERINEAFRIKPHGEAHLAACDVFHSKYDSLAFPGGLIVGMQKLKSGEIETIEAAIQFLETSPRFFRSGYIAEEILRDLKHAPLTSKQRNRLIPIILASLKGGGRRQFHSCAKLAGTLQDNLITSAAKDLLNAENAETRRRAGLVIEIIRSRKSERKETTIRSKPRD
jgi:hypothetical protein